LSINLFRVFQAYFLTDSNKYVQILDLYEYLFKTENWDYDNNTTLYSRDKHTSEAELIPQRIKISSYYVDVYKLRIRRVEPAGSEYFRADVLWVRLRAKSNLIIIGLKSEFHGKCVEFDSRRRQIIKNQRLVSSKRLSESN
jgi:hypothetical protein